MSVKVGVRVRPFNKREEQLSSKSCIKMEANTTYLLDPNGQSKNFVYDYSFWSHDHFTIDPDGIYVPVDNKYADQRKVYDQIGSSILVNAWQGYNCCLFAYGQTGSGKSYSMIGYGPNKGIIPIVCNEIFQKIKNSKQSNKSFEVSVSMMEIYNETIKDLLSHKPNNDLKICQRKNVGVFVEGLMEPPVTSYEEIQKQIEIGSNNRSIAATLMNESSSRSHTIVSIKFKQKIQVTFSQTSIKYSVIHLVDLAGSQSFAKTGISTNKDRLRQTAKINQSLSTLGRVIEALADNADRKDNLLHVPYRDSKLTFILRNALGGNSQTAMICAISPADDNYEETLSTLRYAQRAKKIKNKAIVNQSDVDKLIRMLRQQNEMLKRMLREAKWNKTVINEQIINNIVQPYDLERISMGFEIDQEQPNLLDDTNAIKQSQQLQEELLIGHQANVSTQVEDKSQKALEIQPNVEKILQIFDEQQPYITNISEDQQLSFRVKYYCKNLIIGNKFGQPKPNIILATLGILPQHARIWTQNQQVMIESLMEGANEYIYINGQNISNKTQLMNLDRIIFGNGCVFLVKILNGQPRKPIAINQIDYQFAIGEINIGEKIQIDEQQMRKKIEEQYQIQNQKNKKQAQEKLKREIQQRQIKYKQQLKEIQRIKNNQTLSLRKQLEIKEKQAKVLQEQKKKASQEVMKYLLLEQQLKKQKQQKAVYEQTVVILQQKMNKVRLLEEQLASINHKQQQMKIQIVKKEQRIIKQLQVQRIICNNENILNDYKLQHSKKIKNAKDLRDVFIQKQKIQLNKQLLVLVPIVEKFNLMAKQMNKNIQCILSVQFRYISEIQITEAIKTKGYKSKFIIIIQVRNKIQKRCYFWDIDVFNNRYHLAQQMFEAYLTDPQFKYDNQFDPFWDPVDFQQIGTSFLLIQCILYNISYKGKIQIISQKKSIGHLQIQIKPCNNLGQPLNKNEQTTLDIQSPRQLLQKDIFFTLQIKSVFLNKEFEKIRIEYQIIQDNYRIVKFSTEQKLTYKTIHVLKEITQNTVLSLISKPLMLVVKAIPKQLGGNIQGSFNGQSIYSSFYSQKIDSESDAVSLNSSFQQSNDISPDKSDIKPKSEKALIFDNLQVMLKIEKEYENKLTIKKKKELDQSFKKSKNKSATAQKQKQCQIY